MAGSNMVEHKLRLLIETELDEKQKQQVGKQLKNILEGAAIGFDEAETKKNLTPIIRMIQKLFDKAEMKFDADELIGMPSREALQKVANITANQFQDAFEKALAKSGGVKIDFGNIDMSGIVAPLEKLTQELSDISEKVSNSTKKSVIDIEESVKRLNNIKPKKINSKKPVEQGELPVSNVEATTGDIEKLLSDIDNGTKTSEKLTKLYQHYKESVENDDPWEVQYQHLVRYVHRYETMTKKYLSKNIEQNPELQELYEILAPKAGAAKISLQHFVDMSRGNELSEYKNHPWARESTLKKVEQTLRNGISVKGSVGDYDNSERSGQPAAPTQAEEGDGKQLNAKVPPKESGSKNFEKNAKIKVGAEQAALELIRQRRAEAEAIAEAERKAAAEAKKAATKKVFRVIYEPEEPDDRSREEILAPYGAEYWTDSKTVAETYAEMGDNPVILEGEVVSNKPFIIDAGGHKWNAFGLMRTVEENPEDPSSPIMTDLRDKFPELFKRIDAGEFGRNYGEIQAELNKTIKALGMGYDAVVTRNVIDAADADSFREKSTTYAVLDDGILHVEAAIIGTADEDGLYDFDGKAKKENIPEYYKMPAAPSESMDVSASIPKIEYSADEIQKMIEGLAVLEQKIQHLGEGASIDQSNLPDELARYQRLIQEISSSTIVESEDDRQRLIELREEALRLATALQSFQLNNSDIAGQASAYGITKDASKALMDTEETAKKLRNELEAILRFQFDEIYDALPDDEQKKLQDYGSEWNEISRNIVAGLQAETTAHRNNADAIEDETSAQDKLNEEKKESRSSNTDNGTPATTGTSPDTAGSPNGTVSHDSIQTEELRALLNSITYNVKVVQDVESTEDDKIAIDTEALKSVLDNIIYNVKITHDDNDKQANRIAIDESVLELTLKRVFANVLSPQIEQNDSEPKNEPWAREDTLSNTIKGVLDQIQTNTSKIGAVPQTPANDSDSILSQISKNVLEINGKIVKGTKAQNKDAAKTQKVPAGRDAQILAERIATQKLSLAKFKTELETSGRMTEDIAKKIRGLAISLGMVKDSKGLTKWGEKFKQQKLNVGITDIENKEEQQIEKDALKEKENRIKTLNKLYQEYGVLVERAAAAEGHFKEQLQDEIRDKDAEIWALRDSFDDITPEMFAGFDEAFERGKKIESTKQYEALSKRSDADEIARLKNIEGLEKEIGKLRANADAATNSGVKNALEAEIKLREELIELQKQGLVMDADAETYYRQKFANDTKRAKQNATQETKERKTAFNDAKRLAQREAMLGKTGSAVGRAETTWLSAAGIEGDLPAGFLAEIDEYYNKLDALRKKHQELKNSEMISDAQKKELIEQTMSVNKMTEEIGELVSEYQRLSGDNSTVIGTNTLGTDAGLSAYEQQLKQTVMTATNGKAQIKNFDAATKTLTYTVKTGKNEFTEYTAAVRRADGALVSVQGATKRTETFIEATTRKMKELTSYFSGMAVFNQVGQELRRGIQYVKEIDLALTELRKVTDETEETYDRFLETAAKTADKVGSTIQKVVSSTADWARLGYSMKEAAEFAESTQILMNVSEFTDVSQATDTLISAVQAFGYTAETSMDVVDLLNTIGKQNCRNYIVIYG